jgi:hypothetical protein
MNDYFAFYIEFQLNYPYGFHDINCGDVLDHC